MHKYKVGQQVYIVTVSEIFDTEQCTLCSGHGQVIYAALGTSLELGHRARCPECHGRGEHTVLSKRPLYLASTGVCEVSRRLTSEDHKGVVLQYNIVGITTTFDEDDLFPTREAAQAWCDERNKEKK